MRADTAEYAGSEMDPEVWKWLESRLLLPARRSATPEHFAELQKTLVELDASTGPRATLLFYLATAPDLFAPWSRWRAAG